MLKEHFSRPQRISFAHIQVLLNISVPAKIPSSMYVASLWKLQYKLLTLICSLEALGVNGDHYGVLMTPIILSRLPHNVLRVVQGRLWT